MRRAGYGAGCLMMLDVFSGSFHQAAFVSTDPKGLCNYMVYTWAFKGFLYPDFRVYVCTIVILGPFGRAGPVSVRDRTQGQFAPRVLRSGAR